MKIPEYRQLIIDKQIAKFLPQLFNLHL